jgi:hypothetical protein
MHPLSGTRTAPTTQDGPVPAGTPAPDFSLRSATDEVVSLRDLPGKPVIAPPSS